MYVCINMFVLCIRKITRSIKEALQVLEILPDVFQVVKLLAQLKNLGWKTAFTQTLSLT